MQSKVPFPDGKKEQCRIIGCDLNKYTRYSHIVHKAVTDCSKNTTLVGVPLEGVPTSLGLKASMSVVKPLENTPNNGEKGQFFPIYIDNTINSNIDVNNGKNTKAAAWSMPSGPASSTELIDVLPAMYPDAVVSYFRNAGIPADEFKQQLELFAEEMYVTHKAINDDIHLRNLWRTWCRGYHNRPKPMQAPQSVKKSERGAAQLVTRDSMYGAQGGAA